MKDKDTACYIDNDGVSHTLTGAYDDLSKTFNITGPVPFTTLERIHYLKKGTDLNFCDPASDFYTTATIPDLSGSFASMNLTSSTAAALPITMNFTLKDSGLLNIKWSYTAKPNGTKTPFEVPQEIIDVDRTPSKDKKLSDRVTITQDPTSGIVSVSVMDSNSMTAYTLNGFQLSDYFNHIDATIHTNKAHFKGVLGIFEQVASDLWLKDGIYGLWARDQPDPVQTGKNPSSNMYGTHPFLMGRTQVDS